jgi:hypothetical protein
MGLSPRSAYPPEVSSGIRFSSSSCPLAFGGYYQRHQPRALCTTTSVHGSFAPAELCCLCPRRSYDPIRQSRRLPRTPEGHWLYRRSVPDDLVWAAAEIFPTLGQRSFPPCHHPYAGRRGSDTPISSPLPEAFHHKVRRQRLHYPDTRCRQGVTLRRDKVRFMLRSVELHALLYGSDLEVSPPDEDVYVRAFPRPITQTSNWISLHSLFGDRLWPDFHRLERCRYGLCTLLINSKHPKSALASNIGKPERPSRLSGVIHSYALLEITPLFPCAVESPGS